MSETKRKMSHLWRSMCFLLKPPPARQDVFAGYDRMRQFYIMQRVVSHFKRRLDDPAPLLNQQVLDVGCGLSAVSEFMVLSGAEVTAIDSDANVITAAQEKAKTYGTDITFIEGTPNDLIQSGQMYDVIICLDVLEYITDLDKFLWVTKRLLNPEGLFVFSAINRRPMAWFIHIFLSAWVYRRTPRGSRTYKYFYSPRQIEMALEKQGFDLSHVQGMAFNTQDRNWQLSEKISTRYLAAAKVK